jgi:hypothetical protein
MKKKAQVDLHKKNKFPLILLESLFFWLDVEGFRISEDPTYLKSRAFTIYNRYFTAESRYEINVEFPILGEIRKKIKEETFDFNMFNKAQFSVFKMLQMDSFPRFLNSPSFQKYKGTFNIWEEFTIIISSTHKTNERRSRVDCLSGYGSRNRFAFITF